jgi:hypothetical protein
VARDLQAAIEQEAPGPGRVSRALLGHCLADGSCWTEQLRHSSSAVFAALAQNPSLIEPMRVAYAELHRRVAEDGLPEGLGDVVVASIDGLWLNWVLGLVPVSQERIVRVRKALARWLATADSSGTAGKAKAGKAMREVRRPSPDRDSPRRSQAPQGTCNMKARVVIASSLLLLLVVGTFAGLALWRRHRDQVEAAATAAMPEPSESVVLASASELPFQRSVTAIGTVIALQSVTLRNEMAGTVREVKLVSGQVVEAGDLLVALDVSVEEASSESPKLRKRSR